MFKVISVKRGLTEIRHVRKRLAHLDVVFCGGYIRYCASPRKEPVPAADIDIYCKDDAMFKEVAEIFKEDGLEIRHENAMAVTYRVPKDGPYAYCPAVQLIKPIKEGSIVAKGTIEEILSNFDFTVIRCGLLNDEEVLVDEDFEEDERTKFIRIKNIHCPVSSMHRFMKYGKKGYYTRPGQILKLFADWDNRPDEYRNTLKERIEAITQGKELSQEEIDQLEALMRID